MSDSQARQDIISNVNKNYFVEAGAGSGKTTMLVERMVAMVEQGFPVDKICTITFTKAAANEFYARFQTRLSERSKDEKKKEYHSGDLIGQTEETKARCAKALQNIDSCFMGTIDSFCNMILSEHPLEAGIPADSTVIDEDEIIDRYVKEYNEILANDDYACLRNKYQMFMDTQNDPLNAFRQILTVIIKNRDAEYIFDRPQYFEVEKKYKAEKAELVELFTQLLHHRELAYKKKSGEPDEDWDNLERRRTVLLRNNWDDDFANAVNALKKVKGIRLLPIEDTASVLGQKAAQRLEFHDGRTGYKWYGLDEQFKNFLADLQDYQAAIALDFAVDCVNVMSQILRKQGDLTYFDYKLYLRDMLKKDAAGDHKLIEHIYNRHSYFLIDEFQDTDPMQAEIFFYLAAQNYDEDWKKCQPKPGALFIVGDPKQSIYRFKNADVASFKNVRSLFNSSDSEVLKLTSNFRSTRRLHEWFNDIFGNHILNVDNEDQSRYEDIANEPKEYSNTTGIYKFKPEDRDDDAKEVLDLVNTLVNNPAITIDKNKMVQYKDIMIITGTKKPLNRYVRIFTENHIPFRVEGDMDFNDSPALRDLVAVYKAAVHPDDNFCIYGALISNVYHINAETAMKIKNDLGRMTKTGEFVTDDETAAQAIKEINSYHEMSRTVTPATLMAELIDGLKIFARSGNYNMEYVYYVLELLRGKEANGEIVSCEEAVYYLDDLMNKVEKMERYASLEKKDNRIHLANLHKVKGLEAPVVILAGSRKRETPNSPDKRVEYIGDKPQCYIFGISKAELKFRDSEKKETEKNSVTAERCRHLYVAATRAMRILIIEETQPWKKLTEPVKLKDFFNVFPVRDLEPFVPEKVDGDELYGKAKCVIEKGSVSKNPSVKIHKPSDIEYEKAKEQPETINVKRNPKLIGTLVHKYMEVVVSSGNRVNTDQLISSLCKGLDVEDNYYSDILHRVDNRIQNGGYPQVNGVESDILKELLSADQVYCEVPFSYNNTENSITNGIIDVLYRKGDEWFIIDYKTNADGDHLDEKYRSQLNEYQKAFEKQNSMPVSAKIYHIDA